MKQKKLKDLFIDEEDTYETKEIESERNIIEVIIKKYMNSSIKDM